MDVLQRLADFGLDFFAELEIAKAFFASGAQGLVIAGSGAGSIHQAHKNALKELILQGVVRQDDAVGSLYNIVGFQTNLKWGEQKRVFSMIPGLENAEFVRYGVMHRNTFLNSPKLLPNMQPAVGGFAITILVGMNKGNKG